MIDKVNHPDRIFQVWSYTVGMGRLLLRSVKTSSFPSRIDVLFQNVQALKLPTVMHGLAIVTPGPEEAERISAETGFLPDEGRRFFAVTGSQYDGYIVAGVMTTCMDSGEYFEPSKLLPSEPPSVPG